jgi:protein-disulfide isomerase
MDTRAGRVPASKEKVQITVYADLNCPYCYVLNERLEQMGMAQSVQWLPVEHAPDLYEHCFTDVDRQELIREVEDVLTKAPDIPLIVPSTRPNSRQASKLLARIVQIFERAV